MVVLDWLKPAVIFGSILYAFIGIAVLWLSLPSLRQDHAVPPVG